jgi:hypothetical protein
MLVVCTGRLQFDEEQVRHVSYRRAQISDSSKFRQFGIPTAASRQNCGRVNFRNAFRSCVVYCVSRICVPAARASPRRFSDSLTQKYWLSVFCLFHTQEIMIMHHHPLCCCLPVYSGAMTTSARIGVTHSYRPDFRPPAADRIYT